MTPSIDLPDTSGIYSICCVPTGKQYIGSAVNLRRRYNKHVYELNHGTHTNGHLLSAWNKYGPDAFRFNILEFVLTPFLLERENYWLQKIKPWDKKGFNLAREAGSRLGVKNTPEAIEKTRAAKIGKKRPPEVVEKIAASRRGKPSTRIGYKASPETIERQRQAQTGTKRSEEQRRKMSEAQRGKKMKPESIEKTRLKNLGRKNTPEARERMSKAQQGKTLSEEHKRKIGDASKGRTMSVEARAHISAGHAWHMQTLIVTDPNGETFTIQGIHKFCKEHNLSHSHLIQVARGERNHHKGWKASYPEQ